MKADNKTDVRKGDLVSYVLMIVIYFGFLSIFMEFPSMHRGKTYIKRSGMLIEIDRPVFHAPFGFKGYHMPPNANPEKQKWLVFEF